VDPWNVATEKPTILQLDYTYLVTITKQGVVLVDQHAAHERILYNQFLAALEKEQEHPQVHELTPAYILKLPVTEGQVLLENLETLAGIGFEIDEFGPQTFKVNAVPQILADRKIDQLFNEIIGDLIEHGAVKGVDSVAKRTVAYVACRSAIQAGEVLTESQRQLLLEKLAETTDSFTCPHGRPTTITFSIADLEKLFKRR
jgi:DNA mismatch repair protein MutL